MYDKLLIDFDWVVYRAGFSDLTLEEKTAFIDSTITRITEDCGISDYEMYLTGTTNFRYKVDVNYKIDRKNNVRPDHYAELREYLISRGAIISEDCEADDLCGINSTETTIIVGEDKDLLTIPSHHYRIKKDWTKNEFIDVTEEEAWFNYCVQLLTGDAVDGIQGVKNPAKSHHKNPPNFSKDTASELLKDLSKVEMLDIVKEQYKLQFGDNWFSEFDKNSRLLWIKRDPHLEYYDYI